MDFETGMELCAAWAYECIAWAYEHVAWAYVTLRLTQLFHRLDVITAVTVAGVFFVQRAPVELLTLHTLPRGERTQKLKRRRDICHIPRGHHGAQDEEALLTHRQDLASQPWI